MSAFLFRGIPILWKGTGLYIFTYSEDYGAAYKRLYTYEEVCRAFKDGDFVSYIEAEDIIVADGE